MYLRIIDSITMHPYSQTFRYKEYLPSDINFDRLQVLLILQRK